MNPASNPPILLSGWHLLVSALLLFLPGLLSVVFSLNLIRTLFWNALRCCVQLLFIGWVLLEVFALNHPLTIFGLISLMCLAAAGIVSSRAGTRPFSFFGLEAVCLWISTLMVASIVVGAVLAPDPWYEARLWIPLCGMILGNSLNGIALSLERFLQELRGNRLRLECLQAFGASHYEAARDSLQVALRAGLMPILNAMAAAGLVSLPGMMTGQILAGNSPMQAVLYQIVIIFMIAAAVALGSLLVLILAVRKVFTADGMLRQDI